MIYIFNYLILFYTKPRSYASVIVFLLLDENELVITDSFLHNLLSLTEHSDFKCLLSFQIGQGGADSG